MVRVNSPRAWGTAQDPETDERIDLSDDLDADVARRLAATYDRIQVDEATDDPDSVEEAAADDQDFDAGEFLDRTPMEDVIVDIESGDYDSRLDEIEAAAEREGVLDAIGDRLTEIREDGD